MGCCKCVSHNKSPVGHDVWQRGSRCFYTMASKVHKYKQKIDCEKPYTWIPESSFWCCISQRVCEAMLEKSRFWTLWFYSTWECCCSSLMQLQFLHWWFAQKCEQRVAIVQQVNRPKLRYIVGDKSVVLLYFLLTLTYCHNFWCTVMLSLSIIRTPFLLQYRLHFIIL